MVSGEIIIIIIIIIIYIISLSITLFSRYVFVIFTGFTAKNVTMEMTIPQKTNNVTLMSVFGWIIILSRINSSFPVNQLWTNYEAGFGEIMSNFWLGLNNIYKLTNSSINGGVTYNLRVEVQEYKTNR